MEAYPSTPQTPIFKGGHEEHEVNFRSQISEPFVAFVSFVVRMSFVNCYIRDE